MGRDKEGSGSVAGHEKKCHSRYLNVAVNGLKSIRDPLDQYSGICVIIYIAGCYMALDFIESAKYYLCLEWLSKAQI